MDAPQASNRPTGSSEPAPRRYSAFISYTAADRKLALRLQSRLERYRLPRRIARQTGYSRIKPVFVDRDELRASPDLGDAIRDALARSDFLIVLCTPRTPASHWVGKEIDGFRELRGGRNILVAQFEGETCDCFHPRLVAGRDRDSEPLAADFRPGADGYRLALLKILAGLVSVDLDDLVHRDARRQRARLMTSGGALTAIAAIIAGLSLTAYRARVEVDEGRVQASRAMERQLDDLRAKIKAGGTLDMAAALNRNVELFYDEQPTSSHLPEIDLGRAKLLQAKAEDDRSRGELDAAAADARSAWDISARVLRDRPDDPEAIFVHAQSVYWVGYIAWLQRDTPLAANAFARYADLADRLVKIAPANDDYRLEQGYAYSNLGTIALREARDPERAERYFSAGQAAFREVSKHNPADLNPLYELEDGEAWLADVELFRGHLAAAQQHRDAQARLLDRLLARDPRNQLYRTSHLSSRLGQARLDTEQGRLASARRILRSAKTEAQELIAASPANARIAAQGRAIDLFAAQNELAAGDQPALDLAGQLVGDCSRDWAALASTELPPFCSILAARVALRRGDRAAAGRIMSDPRLASWLHSPSLSPTWRLDFQAECRKLGDQGLCR